MQKEDTMTTPLLSQSPGRQRKPLQPVWVCGLALLLAGAPGFAQNQGSTAQGNPPPGSSTSQEDTQDQGTTTQGTMTEGTATQGAGVAGTWQGPPRFVSVACGVFADGWTVQCTDGVVYGDDLTRYAFCPSGSTVPSCEVGGEGARAQVATCGGACADTTVHAFDTIEEYDAFDPQSLCAP